jgi:hypothetical protein
MQGTDLVNVKLTAEKWNQVLGLLAEGPFRIAAPLITEIREQAIAQANGAAPVANASGGGRHVSD